MNGSDNLGAGNRHLATGSVDLAAVSIDLGAGTVHLSSGGVDRGAARRTAKCSQAEAREHRGRSTADS